MLAACLFALLAAQQPLELAGRVVDADGGPRAGVLVSVLDAGPWTGARTGKDGRFQLMGSEKGILRLSVPGMGRDFRLPKGFTKDKLELGDLTLDSGGSLVGRVLDEDGQVLSREVTLHLYAVRADGLLPHVGEGARVDPQSGEFRFEDLPAATYKARVWVSGERCRGARSLIQVEAGFETFAELHVRVPPRLVLTLVTPGWSATGPLPMVLKSPRGREYIPSFDYRTDAYIFRGLFPRSYLVHMDGAVPFAEVERVFRGDEGAVRVELVPTQGVALTLAFPEGEVPPADARLHVHWDESDLGLMWFGRSPMGRRGWVAFDPGRGALRVPLTDGPKTLEVSPTGWASRLIEVDIDGGWRDLEVVFTRTRPLLLTLFTAGGQPAPGLDLEVTRGVGLAVRSEYQGRSDVRGQARFSLEQEEVSRLHVDWSPWVSSEYSLGPRPPAKLNLVAPASGWAEGRVLLPATTNPIEFSLRLKGRQGLAQLTSDGTFRVGPLPEGESTLLLCGPRGHEFELGSENFQAGATQRFDRDLRTTWPAYLEISCTVNRDPMERGVLYLRPVGVVDGKNRVLRGSAHVVGVPPGEYSLELRDRRNTWIHAEPTPVVLKPGAVLEWSLNVRLYQHHVRFFDGQGKFFTGEMRARHGRGRRIRFHPSPGGTWSASLPAGQIRFWRVGTPEDEAVSVEWTAGAEVLGVKLDG
jgi:hypothetical protein